MGTITNLEKRNRFLQQLRSNVLASKDLAIEALNAVGVQFGSDPKTDGTIVLARYESQGASKSIIGVYSTLHKTMTIYSDDSAEFEALKLKVSNNETAITDEVTRAKKAETDLGIKIDGEITRATEKETALGTRIDEEVERAQAAEAKATTEVVEGTDNSHISIVESSGSSDQKIYTITVTDVASEEALTAEVSRSKRVDNNIIASVGLGAEGAHLESKGHYTKEAKSIEGEIIALDGQIKSNTDSLASVDTRISAVVKVEKERAEGVENGLRTDLGTKLPEEGKAFDRIKSLEASLGEGGSVSKQIEDRIDKISATTIGSEGLFVESVEQTKGVISATTKKLIADSDAILSFNNGIKSTISIREIKENLKANEASKYELVGNNNQVLGAPIIIKKESSLINVSLVHEIAPEFEQEGRQDYLKFEYLTVNGETQFIYIPLGDFLRESEFKNGLAVNSNGEVSVKKDIASEDFLSVSETGVKVSGIQDAINVAKNASKTVINVKGDGKIHVEKKTYTDGDGHDEYTITENDIASAQALQDEIAKRTANEGFAGDEVKYTHELLTGLTTIKSADEKLASEIAKSNSNITALSGRLDIIEGVGEGSFKLYTNNEISKLKGNTKVHNTLEALETALNGEITRSTKQDNLLSQDITTKIKSVNDKIGTKADDSSKETVYGAIKKEEERATAAEQVNANAITAETAARKAVTGVDGDECSYVGTTYLNDQKSLHAADIALDAQVKANADKIATLESGRLSGIKGGNGIEISGDTNTEKTISVKLDAVNQDNALSNGENGLYLSNIWDCGLFEYK